MTQLISIGGIGPSWRKASLSHAANNCVELSSTADFVAVRDSKNPDSPILTYTSAAWSAFLIGAKKGYFDEP